MTVFCGQFIVGKTTLHPSKIQKKKILTTNFQFYFRTNGFPLGVCCNTSVVSGMTSGDALQHQTVRTDDDPGRNVLAH